MTAGTWAAFVWLCAASAKADGFRPSGVPVTYVQHDEGAEEREWSWVGSVGWKLHSAIPPPREGEPLVRQPASDAFYRTPVKAELDKLGVGRLVVTGLQTEHCVDTTCRAAVSAGRAVLLTADPHTTEEGGELPAERIVAHHNETLDDFGNDEHVVVVRPAAEIAF